MICTDKARISFLKKQQLLNFKNHPKKPYGFLKQNDDHQVFTNGLYYIILKGDSQIQDEAIYYYEKPPKGTLLFNRGRTRITFEELAKNEYKSLPNGIDEMPIEHSRDYVDVKGLYTFLDAVPPECRNTVLSKVCCLEIEGQLYYLEAELLLIALKLAFSKVKYVELNFHRNLLKISSDENDNLAYVLLVLDAEKVLKSKLKVCSTYHLD
ncbi:MAG: hypothetical protein NC310_00460 [Roseburia sp.]|nr:hypothetical protein [Anaeroplasma bactoclasticum]MCM1195524.1 hypothetical protein [Roseburia sp.]MCM1556900.1 hypothetical protein [Anaeroplasma bactoclasticum]